MKTTKLFLSFLMMIAFVTFSSQAFSQSEANTKFAKGINQKIKDLDQMIATKKNTSLPEYAQLVEKMDALKKDINEKSAELTKLEDNSEKGNQMQASLQELTINYRKLADAVTKKTATPAETKK